MAFIFSATILVAAVFAYVFYFRILHPLASIPGPFVASLSRLWLVKHVWSADMVWTVMDLHKKHGPLVRTGPNEVSVSDVAAVKRIYGAGSRFRKSPWYSVWQGRRKFDLFPERDESTHSVQKRLVSRIYSMSALKDLEPYVNDCIGDFLAKMEKKTDEVIDLGHWLQLFAFGESHVLKTASLKQC